MEKLKADDDSLSNLTKQDVVSLDIFKDNDFFDFVADSIVIFNIPKNQGGEMYLFLIKDEYVYKVVRNVSQINIDANPEKNIPFIIKYLSGNKTKLYHPIFKLIFEKIANNITIKVDNFLK